LGFGKTIKKSFLICDHLRPIIFVLFVVKN